jgi:hypothetical protein
MAKAPNISRKVDNQDRGRAIKKLFQQIPTVNKETI